MMIMPLFAVAAISLAASPIEEVRRVPHASESAMSNVAEPIRLDFSAIQDEPLALEEQGHQGWRGSMTAYAWLTAMDGNMRRGPLSADVDASFGDILDASDSLLAFSGRLEIGKGRWTGYIDGMWAEIGADDQTGPAGLANIDITTEILLLDFGLMYRVLEQPAENAAGRAHVVDAFVGGRYQDLKLTLDPELAMERSGSKDWIDPIIGVRAVIQLSERFDVTLQGDIGGFGVGSDLTWSLRSVLGWHFAMFDQHSVLYAGYAALGTDYTDGSGASRFEWDMILHGPVLGLSIHF